MTLTDFPSATLGRNSVHRLVPRLWVFVWIGLGLLIPGLVIQNATISLGFTISSTTFFAIALVVMGLNRRYLASTEHFHESLDIFVHNDNAPTFFVSDDGEITYTNHAARARFGEVVQKSLVMVLSAYSANPVNVIFRLQNKARRARSASEDIVTDTGHLRLSAHYIGPQGFIWRLENLVERTEDTQGMAREIQMPMLVCNKDGRILQMNRALRNLLGQDADHLDRVFSELPIDTAKPVEISAISGKVQMRVARYEQENGQFELFFLQNDSTNSVDTSENGFDDLPVALIKLSSDGVVTAPNKLARQLFGGELALDTRLGALVKGLGRPVGDWLNDAIAGRSLNKPEVVQICDNSSDRFLQISLSRVVEGDEMHLMAVLSDATELKTLEAQFVQSQKMQAIGQLAGGVAHDFNNLLTAISGYCDLLLLRHDEGDPDYGDLIQITQNANRAASLVNQLLAFSRKQNLQPEVLDMPDILSELTHLLNRLLGEKTVLSVQQEGNLPKVHADKRQLEQVLMNLVVNARDAMPDGGEVQIVTAELKLFKEMWRERALIAAGNYLSIKVSDRGTGISQVRLGKIFEPFYTTKKLGEGTGLGLSMVYGIIKQSGGFIFVESEVGQGATFEILLPALEPVADAVNAPVEIEEVKTVRPKTPIREEGVILLVEDEAPVRAFAARALSMRGYTVLEAGDADEALALLEDVDLNVDLFVTDVVMPGKDGPTWVREALKTRPQVKVVFVSGYAEESFADQQADIVNSVFLPKPFSLTDLTEKVRLQLAA
ncbi:MAG: two-component system cell cycle sensor histidine kinase/response regulator CckA [Paracoccaceae bacterium]|jgi:two-component system cell cycle sensor histidine kinase/response regulator CckA